MNRSVRGSGENWGTDTHDYENDLENQRDYFRSLVENSLDAMVVMDGEGTIYYRSPSYERLLGYKTEELHGSPFDRIHADDLAGAVDAFTRLVREKDATVRMEVRVQHQDGTWIPIEATGHNQLDREPVKGIVVSFRDIRERKTVEDALRESEERYSTLIKSLDDIAYIVGSGGEITFLSSQVERFGYDPQELISQNFVDLICPEDRERITHQVLKTFLGEKDYEETATEFRIVARDGTLHWVEERGQAIRNSEGIVVGMSGILRDIDDRRQAEQELRESEEKFRTIFENANDAIIYLDESGTVIDANNQLKDVFGYEREEVIGRNFAEFAFADSEAIGKTVELFNQSFIAQPIKYLSFPATRKDGTAVIVEASTRIVRRNEGQTGCLAVLRDITTRNRTEKALRESEEKYRLLVENVGTPILYFTLDGDLMLANKEGARILGGTQDALIGKSIHKIMPTEGVIYSERFRYIRRTGRGEEFDDLIEMPSGKRWFRSNMQPVRGSTGQIFAFQVVVTDITERKLAEEDRSRAKALEELDQLRTALLASISHELRTPLTSIKGLASSLVQPDMEWDEETQKDFLQSIDESSDRLAHIVDDLLDMSQLESGMMKLDKQVTMVSVIMKQIKAQLGDLTMQHRFKVNISPDLPVMNTDEVRIGQVITNLVSNAAAYSEPGTEISLEIHTIDSEIIVSVADQGVGISAEHAEKIFDRFYRLESGVTRRRDGTGLGLSICKGIVEHHGGRIWVESKPEKGSLFKFSLPIEADEVESLSSG